jgi:hypothetical protein
MSDGGLLGWPTWVGIVVQDIETQRAFWGELLGVPEDLRDPQKAFHADGPVAQVDAQPR